MEMEMRMKISIKFSRGQSIILNYLVNKIKRAFKITAI